MILCETKEKAAQAARVCSALEPCKTTHGWYIAENCRGEGWYVFNNNDPYINNTYVHVHGHKHYSFKNGYCIAGWIGGEGSQDNRKIPIPAGWQEVNNGVD